VKEGVDERANEKQVASSHATASQPPAGPKENNHTPSLSLEGHSTPLHHENVRVKQVGSSKGGEVIVHYVQPDSENYGPGEEVH